MKLPFLSIAIPWLLLISVTCAINCPENQFSSGIKCVLCPSSCTKCRNLETCTACASGFQLSNNKCEAYQAQIPGGIIAIIVMSNLCLVVTLISIIYMHVTKKPSKQLPPINEHIHDLFKRLEGRQEAIKKLNVVAAPPSQNEVCSICLGNGCNAALSCLQNKEEVNSRLEYKSHYFHFSCIQVWAQKNTDCPVCRDQNLSCKVECENCRQYSINIPYCLKTCGKLGSGFVSAQPTNNNNNRNMNHDQCAERRKLQYPCINDGCPAKGTRQNSSSMPTSFTIMAVN